MLRLLSKCSFTPGKLRFFGLRRPKINFCYTISIKKSVPIKLVGHALFYFLSVQPGGDDGFGQKEVIGVVDVDALDAVGDGGVGFEAYAAVVLHP